MKRLIVFGCPYEGRKWTNGRDNWAADSWVDYGLWRLSKGEKKWGKRETKEKTEKEGRDEWKVHVVRCSRRAHLAFLGRGRTLILFSPWGDPWPLACSSLLQVQALTASSSHTDTHCKLIFHTLCKECGGGKRRMKTQILFTLSPPCFFSFMPFHCQGLKIQTCLLGWGSVVAISGPFSFLFFSEKFSHQENELLSLNLGGKMIWHGSIITGLLIRGMSCIITIVFDNTTANHLRPLAKVSQCY